MKFSKKLKVFSQSFTAFMKSNFNSKHFEKKKDESNRLCLSQIIDHQISAYVNL